ncbi:hypothetical protein MHLP_01800 [Candidatus Mycoplasma haematolamae str. Purdue]|uniref:Uncharacterized protein n=1 Tax=Mycoplasma haematolamae (strain Purdue) TaxID=1212765 RepID=I7B9L3_MYCHA|nr:hypothetical protein [Candidatus Mycoplasma haematolamae]AFO51940.1 hypothetical protein MHLP_01800 [Candidatus Mycoplasma haematolamae str. Purdue]
MYQDLVYELADLKRFTVEKKEKTPIDYLSEGCQDEVEVSIEQLHPCIARIKLILKGCVISRASTNAVCLEIEGKSSEEASKIVNSFLLFLDRKECDLTCLSDRLKLFERFSSSKSRYSCLRKGALLIQKILQEDR